MRILSALILLWLKIGYADVQINEKGKTLTLQNEIMTVDIEPDGGRISRLVYKPGQVDMTWWGPYQVTNDYEPGGGLLELNFWDPPSCLEFRLTGHEWQVARKKPEQAVVTLTHRGVSELNDLAVTKRLTLNKNDNVLDVLWSFKNAKAELDYAFYVGPVLRAVLRTGSCDGTQRAEDSVYFIPTTTGVRELPYSPEAPPAGMSIGQISNIDNLARGWIGVVGKDKNGAALIADYRYLKGFGFQYLPQWPEITLHLQRLTMLSGQTVEIPYSVFLFHGLDRVDEATTEMVGSIGFDQASVNPGMALPLTVSLFSRRNCDVTINMAFQKLPDGEWRELMTQTNSIKAHEPFVCKSSMTPVLEGTYVLKVIISDLAKKPLLTMQRPVVVGKASAVYTVPPETSPIKMAGLIPKKLAGPATENIIKWLKPSAAGTIKALFLVPAIWTRELVELQQRMDIDIDVVTTAIIPSRDIAPEKESRIHDEDRELIEQFLKSGKHDVMVVRGVPYAAFPETLQKLIVDRVSEGMGLVYVPERTLTPSTNTLIQQNLLTNLTEHAFDPVDISLASKLGFDKAMVKTSGKGRVVFGGNVTYGLTPENPRLIDADWRYLAWGEDDLESVIAKYPAYWEYWYAGWAKVLTWASRKEPAAAIQSQPDSLDKPVVVVKNNSPDAKTVVIAYALADTFNRELAGGKLDVSLPAQSQKELLLPLPKIERNGILRLHLFVADRNGSIHDFAAKQFVQDGIVSDFQLASAKGPAKPPEDGRVKNRKKSEAELISENDMFLPDEPIRFNAKIKAGAAVKVKLELQLVDCWDRVVYSKTVSKKLVAGDNPVNFEANAERGTGKYLEARLLVFDGDKLLNESRCDVFIKVPRKTPADICPAGIPITEQPAYLVHEFFLKQQKANGIKAIVTCGAAGRGAPMRMFLKSGFDFWETGEGVICGPDLAGWYQGITKGSFKGGNSTGYDIGNHCRNMCFNNPAHMEDVLNGVRHNVKAVRKYSLPFYGLADEPQLARKQDEVCYCDNCLKAFRADLKKRYADIQALNGEWDAKYDSFDQVMPLRADQLQNQPNPAPWLEYRMFMARCYADMFRQTQVAIRAEDGDPNVMGGLNEHGESPITAATLYLFAKNMQGLVSYPQKFDCARSFYAATGTPQANMAKWTGYGIFNNAWDLWNLIMWGGPFPQYFYCACEDIYGRRRVSAKERVYYSLYDPEGGCVSSFYDGAGNPGKHFAIAVKILKELELGLGALLINSPVQPAPAAVILSYEDHYVEHLKPTETGYSGYGGKLSHLSLVDNARGKVLNQGIMCDYLVGEQIENGALTNYQAMVLPKIRFISDKALAALESYIDKNGKIIGVQLDAKTFAQRSEKGGWREDNTARERLLDKVQKQGGSFTNALPPAEIGIMAKDIGIRPEGFWPVIHHSGSIAYYGFIRISSDINNEFRFSVNKPGYVYDVREKRLVGPAPCVFEKPVKKDDAVVLALLPYTIEGIVLKARYVEKSREISYSIKVAGSSNAAVQDHIVRLEVYDPKGQLMEAYTKNLVAKSGKLEGVIRLACNDPFGDWKLVAREIISGKETAASVQVKTGWF